LPDKIDQSWDLGILWRFEPSTGNKPNNRENREERLEVFSGVQ
jgi:hypothetical protein